MNNQQLLITYFKSERKFKHAKPLNVKSISWCDNCQEIKDTAYAKGILPMDNFFVTLNWIYDRCKYDAIARKKK